MAYFNPNKKKRLADIPVKTLEVDLSHHGTRWSNAAWITADHEKIAGVFGPLSKNYLGNKEVAPRQAFKAYLDQHLSPETVRAVYEVEHFYSLAYNAFMLRARADHDAKRRQRVDASLADEALAA